MTQTTPPTYSLDEMLYRQYIASLAPNDTVGTCKSAIKSALGIYLEHLYHLLFWVEDIDEAHTASYMPLVGGVLLSLPEWARQEELAFDQMGNLDVLITKQVYDQKRVLLCAWCETPSLLCTMGVVTTKVDSEGMASAEVYVCDPCLEPLRQQQKEHDDTCEPADEFIYLENGE